MCKLAHVIRYTVLSHNFHFFAVLERWLIYDCETERSFVYLIMLINEMTNRSWADLDACEEVETVVLVEVRAVDAVVFQPAREARFATVRQTVQYDVVSLRHCHVRHLASYLWRTSQARWPHTPCSIHSFISLHKLNYERSTNSRSLQKQQSDPCAWFNLILLTIQAACWLF